MNNATAALIAVFTGITGVALLAVIVSRNSATSDVLSSLGNAYASALKVAVSPISGSVQ